MVANNWKHSGEFRRRTKWLRNFADEQDGCEMISQPSCSSAKIRSHFVRLRNSPECFQIFAINVFCYFASDICCLNPNSLLVIHQLDDSLVVKQGYRGKQPVIYCFVIFILRAVRELSPETNFCKVYT